MPRFKVGDKVWSAKCKYEQIQVVCPTCFGTKEVILILGNGERVVLPCEGCTRGYNPPAGYILEYDYIVKPELITITDMTIEINAEKEIITYRSGSYCFDDENLFLTEEEARAKAKIEKNQLDEDQKEKDENIKQNVYKSFSWNASYHRREAKRLKEQALSHDKKAKLCQKRTRK